MKLAAQVKGSAETPAGTVDQLRVPPIEIVDPEFAEKEAFETAVINDILGQVASDFHEAQLRVKAVDPKSFTKQQQAEVEQYLHVCSALCTFRINFLQETFPHSDKIRHVAEVLDDVRVGYNSVRFLPFDYVAEQFPHIKNRISEAFSQAGISWEGTMVLQYDTATKQVPDELISDITEMCQKLTIDESKSGSQDGFGRVVSKEEVRSMLAVPGTQLFVLSHKEESVGFFIVHNEPESFPQSVKESITHLSQSPGEQHGWLAIAGIKPGARLALHREGIHAYKLLTSMVVQACYAHDIDELYAEVRVGEKLNIARKSHLRIGFRDTGIVREHDGAEYELLSLHPADLPFYTNRRLFTRYGSSSPNQEIPLPTLKKIISEWDYRDPETIAEGEICMPNRDSRDAEEAIRVARYSTEGKSRLDPTYKHRYLDCRDGIVIQFDRENRLYSMRQLFPNQDIWTCDFHTDHHKIGNFMQGLAWLREADELRHY